MKGRKKKNPQELLVFGKALAGIVNPTRGKQRRRGRNATHKANCPCFACKHARGEKRARPAKTNRAAKRANPKRRTNQVSEQEQAVQLYERFHGKEPKEIIEAQRSAAMRLDYTALGDLVAIGLEIPGGWKESDVTGHWDELDHIGFQENGVKLASSPNGKQLYCIGGQQKLGADEVEALGGDPSKDLADLGEARFVVYFARKRVGKYQPIEYVHILGGPNELVPRVCYDKLREEIFFVGGEYTVEPEGITN
jgi:hypothetical protein